MRESRGTSDAEPVENISVLIADDHALLAESLRAVRDAEPGIPAVGVAGTLRETEELLDRTSPDVLLLDQRMPDGDGIASIASFKRRHPRTAIVVVTAVGLATGEREALVRALVAMILARSFFWVLWFVRSAGMGFGDVRLAAPVGLVLGWTGWGALAIGLWASFMLFVVPALVVLLARRDRSLLKRSFPFGPFMVGGALVGLVWGTALAGRMWG